MGAVIEGFDAARKRRDDHIAERRRKENVVDHELHDLADVLSQDAKFLKDNGVTFEITNRTMRIMHDHSPMVTVPYGADEQTYTATVMHDGSHATMKTTDECAKGIGEMLFAVLAPTQG